MVVKKRKTPPSPAPAKKKAKAVKRAGTVKRTVRAGIKATAKKAVKAAPKAKKAPKAAAAGKTLKLELIPSSKVVAYEVDVDGKKVYFSGDDKAEVSVAPGDHDLSWAVIYTPGQKVELKITAPATAVWSDDNAPSKLGRWDGVHPFHIYA